MVAAGSAAATLTVTLIAPDTTTAYTETQADTGIGNSSVTGVGRCADIVSQVGTYYWNVSYNANGSPFDTNASHGGQNDTSEQETRSEERRVGKECRSRRSTYH